MGVYTNTMRYTGTSGVDVESMVQALMKSEGMKADRIYRERQKLEWEQQMFRDMGTSVRNFNNSYLSFSSSSTIVNMRSTNAYAGKTVTGKFSGGDSIASGSSKNSLNIGGNSSIATTGNTPPGDYTFDINSVATGDTYTSNKMSSNVTSKTNIDNVVQKTVDGSVGGLQAGDFLDVTVNGSTKRLTLTSDDITAITDATKAGTTADGATVLAEKLNDKIDAQFGKIGDSSKVEVTVNDAGQLNFQANTAIGTTFAVKPAAPGTATNLTSVTSGQSLMNGIADADGKFAVDGSDTYKIKDANGVEKEITVNYTAGVTTKEDYISSLNAELAKPENNIQAVASLNSKGQLAITTRNTDIDVEVTGVTRNAKDTEGNPAVFTMTGISKADAAMTNKISFDTNNLSSTFNVNKKIDSKFIGNPDLTFADGSKVSLTIGENTTYKDVMNQINSSGKASLTFNTNTNSFTLQSKKLGTNGAITGVPDVLNEAFQLNPAVPPTNPADATAKHTAGTNAEVHVKGPNGIDQILVRETNTFSYADINFKLDPSLQTKINETEEKSLKIEMSVTANTDEAFDNIKGFVDAYNTLIGELSAATDTPRAKSGDYSYYEPLTEEEKEGMTDEQIKKMEDKAKQGLLNRNPELTRLQSKLREITTTQVTLKDGSKMSLASIGITTGDYTQGGKLFIDEDKLRNALETNADGVATLFTDSKNGVAEKMYNAINDAVGSDGYITKKVGFTDSIYSKDNYYTKQIEQKSKELDRMNDYLIGKENYYYSMFANMEKVISEANNQMAALSNY